MATRKAPSSRAGKRSHRGPRRGPDRLEMVCELLDDVLKLAQPADAAVTGYFRSHPQLGQADRAVFAQVAFDVLRRRLEYSHLAQGGSGPLTRRLGLLALADRASPLLAGGSVSEEERTWLSHVLRIDRTKLPLAIRSNLPPWVLEKLHAEGPPDAVSELAFMLNQPAPMDLRVNLQKVSREEALASLKTAGISAAATPYSPAGIRAEGHPALARLDLFQSGGIEVQDEGSQLLAYLVAPKRGEFVVDFCAGAGGKTLALGMLMRSTGRLYAMDVSVRRLERMKPRLARSGLSNVHPMALDSERDPKLKRLAGKADRVLVDAPCSGLGTLRRNPDLKWRQTPASVDEMREKQAGIMRSAARLVKAGGVLVYATCSLLREENEAIVDAFLAEHPEFSEANATEVLSRQGIEIDMPGPRLRLWPHEHGTDGFFGSVLIRQAP